MATPLLGTAPTLLRIAADARRRTTRTLLVALVVSLLLHLAWSLWPVEPTSTPDAPVLTATLKEMPAPPVATAPPAAAKPKPHRPRSVLVPKKHEPAPIDEAQSAPDAAPAPSAATPEPQAVPAPDVVIGPPTVTPPPPGKVLPPRLDLAYKVFLGTQGFLIGDATYRFEHDADTYRIATVAQARGLAALLVHGRGRIESRGHITAHGLRPDSFEIERGSPDKREIATFDWQKNVLTLHDQKTAPLDTLTFDPLTILWQTYFTPPNDDRYAFSVATTRRVYHYTVTREGEERIAWPQGEVDTERWHRVSEDSKTEAWFWLAPSMHYIPIKIRVTQTSRGTLEALLDAIRTDARPGSPDAGDDLPPLPSPIERTDPFVEHGS